MKYRNFIYNNRAKFDTINRGDVLRTEELEKIFGVRHPSKQYRLEAFEFIRDFKHVYFDWPISDSIFSLTKTGDIVIRTDSEMLLRCHQKKERAIKNLYKALTACSAINRENLMECERVAHDSQIEWLTAISNEVLRVRRCKKLGLSVCKEPIGRSTDSPQVRQRKHRNRHLRFCGLKSPVVTEQ